MTTDTAAVVTTAIHPLLAQLIDRPGFARVTAATAAQFCAGAGTRLLVFTEDPARYRETLDLAVIVPELVRSFPGRFAVGVLLADDARAVAVRFGFRRWPALVVLRDGGYVGAIDGLRNWDDYVTGIAQLLEAPVTRAPSIGIAVATAPPAAPGSLDYLRAAHSGIRPRGGPSGS